MRKKLVLLISSLFCLMALPLFAATTSSNFNLSGQVIESANFEGAIALDKSGTLGTFQLFDPSTSISINGGARNIDAPFDTESFAITMPDSSIETYSMGSDTIVTKLIDGVGSSDVNIVASLKVVGNPLGSTFSTILTLTDSAGTEQTTRVDFAGETIETTLESPSINANLDTYANLAGVTANTNNSLKLYNGFSQSPTQSGDVAFTITEIVNII